MLFITLFIVNFLIGASVTTAANITPGNRKLWPYGEDCGDKVMDKTTVNGNGASPKSVVFDLNEDIKWFGDREISKIKIFENGLISRDVLYTAPLCPQNVFKGFYLSAYWVPTDIRKSGKVYYRQEKPGTSRSGLDYESLVREIRSSAQTLGSEDFFVKTSKGAGSELSILDVKSAVVITWEKMVQPSSIFANPKHTNTFQLVLLATERGTYAHFVFAQIDYFHFVSRYSFCRRAGTTAITERSYHFEMTSFFYLDSSNMQLHSNIPNYTRSGRYVMLLKKVKYQPSPPRLNCSPDVPNTYCRTGLPENFCRNKATGRYKHPSFCKKFVLCNGGNVDVQDCGNSLVYNPWIQNCDWPHSYRCEDTDFPNMMRMFATQSRLGHFNPLVSIRYDRINLRFSTHNNTCVGVPEWGNTVDISSCSNYLMCSNTRTFIMPCPPSHDGQRLYFNPLRNTCDFKKNVECENGKRPASQTTTNNGHPIIITPPPQITRQSTTTELPSLPSNVNPCYGVGKAANKADPFSCDHYYSCREGRVFQRTQCPTSWNGFTLFYNPGKDQCVYRDEVNCMPLSRTMAMNGKD